eukprot:CAMPEP_0115400534 /NCGR_PEP_ID=MMETSP0271-20121206/15405_1 /TAXON_ID=71861 /ORGANISM="Scrippsiella trochoidea, Strain CCMP3099" /LENGTH=137 /DNA_ID=CAMNT_0002824387 /DNA_START=513 /DNA_END=923 /DNA_ORIENTATION=-
MSQAKYPQHVLDCLCLLKGRLDVFVGGVFARLIWWWRHDDAHAIQDAEFIKRAEHHDGDELVCFVDRAGLREQNEASLIRVVQREALAVPSVEKLRKTFRVCDTMIILCAANHHVAHPALPGYHRRRKEALSEARQR